MAEAAACRIHSSLILDFLVVRIDYAVVMAAVVRCTAVIGLALLRGGDLGTLERVIRNLAASITGMICDGGNEGCTMKGIVAVDAAFRAVSLALRGIAVAPVHGICAATPEATMRNMGRIASPGMVGTEKTMIEILEEK